MYLMMRVYAKFDTGVFFQFFQFKNKFLLSVYKSNDGVADFLTFVVCSEVRLAPYQLEFTQIDNVL